MSGKDHSLPTGVRPLAGSENWPRWKGIIRQFFKANGLWGLVEETEKCPDPPTPLPNNPTQQIRDAFERGTKKIADWNLRNERVIDILYRTVDDAQSHIIMKDELTTPKQLWDALLKNFDQDTSSNKRQLLKRLLVIKQGELTVDKFFAEISDAQNRLTSLKVTVDPDILVTVALEGLAPKYEMIRTSLDAKDELTLDQIQVAVRNAENRMEESDPLPPDSALKTSVGGKYQKSSPNRNSDDSKCYNCGGYGHFARRCPKNCNNCGGLRHFATSCPSPKISNQLARQENSSDSESDEGCGNGKRGAAMCASTETSFIIDSGATTHMVNNSDLLCDFEKLKTPLKIIMGDGKSCAAVSEGHMILICDVNNREIRVTVDKVLVVPKLSANLLSVPAAAEKGNSFAFGGNGIEIRDAKDTVIALGTWHGKTPILRCRVAHQNKSGISKLLDSSLQLFPVPQLKNPTPSKPKSNQAACAKAEDVYYLYRAVVAEQPFVGRCHTWGEPVPVRKFGSKWGGYGSWVYRPPRYKKRSQI